MPVDIMEGPSIIKTKINIEGTTPQEVVALKDPTNYDHTSDEDAARRWQEKRGEFVLEVFWKMERKEEARLCNMQLHHQAMTYAGSLSLPQSERMSGGARSTLVPFAVPMRDIPAGEELILHYPKEGRKLEPRAKITKSDGTNVKVQTVS
jgi:hypothetical protein